MAPQHDWSILSLLKWVTSYFFTHQIDSPRSTAEILLAHSLGCRRIDLYLKYDQPLTAQELARFKALLKRRINKEPVAYIVGSKEFWSLDLKVGPNVLIPRSDTECLVETTLNLLKGAAGNNSFNIIELGTGSGAVITALASMFGQHCYYAMDYSFKALELARENANINDCGQLIHFFQGSWFDALKNMAQFDIVISNPPYIPTADIETLQPEIRCFEPRPALDGGIDGLASILAIIDSAHNYIKPGGFLLLEIGYDQKKPVQSILAHYERYDNLEFLKDYNGIDRVMQVRRK